MSTLSRILLVVFLFLGCLGAVSAQPTLSRRNVATGLDTPYEILWGPDNWIWMTERGGRVSRVNPETGEVKLLLTIPDVFQSNESGLLGLAVNPDPADTPYVFVAYTYMENFEIKVKLVRYLYNGTTLINPVTLLFRIAGNSTNVGCRLLIVPGRKLLMATGDANYPSLSQSHFELSSKVLRLNFDGTAPPDNPSIAGAPPLNTYWASGFRNPQGLTRSPNGVVYLADQGLDQDDELNIINSRRNYGWPNVTGACDVTAEMKFCQDSSVVVPIKAWTPTIGVAGMEYYNSPAIPDWQNSILMTTLAQTDLRVLKLNAAGSAVSSETIYYNDSLGRLRDLCIAPDGRIFLATNNKDGQGAPRPGDDKIVELGANVALGTVKTLVVSGDSAGTFQAGLPVIATITTTGKFDAANVFTLQLSDAAGSFSKPTDIGTLAGDGGGSIGGTIPCDLPSGNGYRFRVFSTNPAQTLLDTMRYAAVAAPRAVISPSTDVAICEGDSVVFTGRPGNNRWSTGDSTRTITVRQAGSYWTTFDSNGCLSTSDTITVTVTPLPKPEIVMSGVNTLDAGTGYTSYQWLLNDTAITGATSRTYVAQRSGIYTVRVRNAGNCTGTSQPLQVDVVAGIATGSNETGRLLLYPHPAHDRMTLELELRRAGPVEITLVDMSGRPVLALRDERGDVKYRRELSLEQVPAGSYLLEVRSGSQVWRRLVVRER